jgi:hypothetical protein
MIENENLAPETASEEPKRPEDMTAEERKEHFVNSLKKAVADTEVKIVDSNNDESIKNQINDELSEGKNLSASKEAASEETETETEEEKKKRKRNSAKERINKVIKEKHELERALELERQEKARLQAYYFENTEKNIKEKEILYQSSYDNYVTALDSQYKDIKERLKQAEIEGDFDTKIEAQEILLDIKKAKEEATKDYEQAIHELYEEEVVVDDGSNRQPYPSQDSSYHNYNPDDIDFSEDYRRYGLDEVLEEEPTYQDQTMQIWNGFLTQNPWYDTESERYNPTLAQPMNESINQLIAHLELNNQTHLVTQEELLEAALNLTKEKLGIEAQKEESAPKRQSPQQAPRKPRASTPISPNNDYAESISTDTRHQVRLTEQEKSIAEGFARAANLPVEKAYDHFRRKKLERGY